MAESNHTTAGARVVLAFPRSDWHRVPVRIRGAADGEGVTPCLVTAGVRKGRLIGVCFTPAGAVASVYPHRYDTHPYRLARAGYIAPLLEVALFLLACCCFLAMPAIGAWIARVAQ